MRNKIPPPLGYALLPIVRPRQLPKHRPRRVGIVAREAPPQGGEASPRREPRYREAANSGAALVGELVLELLETPTGLSEFLIGE